MNECMEWTGAKFVNGYPEAKIGGKKVRVHRYVWEWVNGRKLKPWPQEVVMHTCDNRLCLNPAHLRAASQAENLQDMRDKGRGWTPPRQVFCKNGHEMTDANVYVWRGERNRCKACAIERQRARRASR